MPTREGADVQQNEMEASETQTYVKIHIIRMLKKKNKDAHQNITVPAMLQNIYKTVIQFNSPDII